MLRKKLKLDPISNDTKCLPVDDNLSENCLQIEYELCQELDEWQKNCDLRKSKVQYVYKPLYYASEPHSKFIRKYCNSEKKILFLGMNPGPFGMSQTGVPFGEVEATKNWLEIDGDVFKPELECPFKPVKGFLCETSEVSGRKFWGLFKSLGKTPNKFFENSFVYNYCPIAFMDEKGRNIIPENIKAADSKLLEELCNAALLKILQLYKVDTIIGLGRYAEKKGKQMSKLLNDNITVHYLKHPSPIIPKNENWHIEIEQKLSELNLLTYFKVDL